MVHLQGGGWCTSIDECTQRALTDLGSSDTYGDAKDDVLEHDDGGAHGLFSNSSTVNPDFHNWNKVYVRYCDGASFSGDVASPVASSNGQLLYFRGRRILDVVTDDIV